MLIELNEIERETILKILGCAIANFHGSSYNDIVEAYPSNDMLTCYLPTKAHIKALKKIESKITSH